MSIVELCYLVTLVTPSWILRKSQFQRLGQTRHQTYQVFAIVYLDLLELKVPQAPWCLRTMCQAVDGLGLGMGPFFGCAGANARQVALSQYGLLYGVNCPKRTGES